MIKAMTDEVLRTLLGGSRSQPLGELEESSDGWWHLFTFAISKSRAVYSDGWTHPLRPESRLYKRWFEFPDIGMRGWAIIFRIFDPTGEPEQMYETFPGWVPPDREKDADRWIEFLNAQIRDRISTSASPGKKSAGTLTLIDHFREFGYEHGPSILPLRGKGRSLNKDAVLRYLSGGKLKVMSPGLMPDVFDPSRTADSMSILTDGTYAWHELLAYYVQHYDVALPAEFEAHMARNGFEVPGGIDTRSLKFEEG